MLVPGLLDPGVSRRVGLDPELLGIEISSSKMGLNHGY